MIQSVLEFLGKISWPIAFLIFIYIFKNEVKEFLKRITTVSFGGGSIEAKPIDQEKIRKAKEIRETTSEPREQAQLLLEQGALENRELRILRGLVGERGGRSFYTYRKSSYYSPALESLTTKRLISLERDVYSLTNLGLEVAKIYLAAVLGMKD
jgi:hypothetical protein